MISATVKLTSKRQVTFPAELCEQMELNPGDVLELISRTERGELHWVLRKRKSPHRSWLGSLNAYAEKVEDHSIKAIRNSIQSERKAP